MGARNELPALLLVFLTAAAGVGVCQSQTFSIPSLRLQLATALPGTVFEIPAGTHLVDKPLLCAPGVVLRGAGMDATTLLLDRTKAANFGYGFVIAPKNQAGGVSVSGLTIDGGRTPTATSTAVLPANQGGGLSVGSNWVVEDVRFTNLNYFKLWARNVSNVVVRRLVFEELSSATESGGNDNIGGGQVDSMLVEDCVVQPSARGNGLDLLRSRNLTVSNCQFLGSPAGSHNVYLEGVVDSTLRGNRLEYSSIVLQSDKGYSDTTWPINPARNTVQGNTLLRPVLQGVSVRYDNGTLGGGNALVDNRVEGAGASGVITFAVGPGFVAAPDVVTGNTVVDPFRKYGTGGEWNTGYGITKSAGITLAAGPVVAGGNTITSDVYPVGSAALYSGTQVGLRSSRKVAVPVTWVADDTVSGASLVRFFQPL